MEKTTRCKMSDGTERALTQIGNYKFLGRTLGKGNFAKVELAEHRLTGAKVAIKIINLNTVKEDYVKRNILREALIMKKVRHENVIKLYETLKYDCIYCLVTELVKGGDLRTYVQHHKNNKLSEGKARSFFRQLLSAVKHLHECGIVHRDLKMDNILLDETKTVIKIVDFGLSNLFNKGELLRTHCGSPEYAAPELFEKGCLYGPSVDVWSMGVVLYGMVIGHLPFSTMFRGCMGKDELYIHAKKGLTIAHERYLGKISTGCRSLLMMLLQPDPTKRISFEQMSHHSWITEEGKNPLLRMPSFLIPKSIRTKVIDRVATLCSKSVSDAELHVQSSNHDAVCAVYNLLLDDAMKEYKSRTKPRTKQRPGSSIGRKHSDGRVQRKTEHMHTSSSKTNSRSSKRAADVIVVSPTQRASAGDASCLDRRDDESKTENQSISSEKSKSQASSIKIVEFPDSMKTEGRTKSPVIRRPTPVNRYWKAYRPQNDVGGQSTEFADVKSYMLSEAARTANDSSDRKCSRRHSNEAKHQVFCGNVPGNIEPYCRITRFPEEDRSSRRPKVDARVSVQPKDPKQMIFAAGFRMTSLSKKIDAISSNGASNSFHGCKNALIVDKPKVSKSFDNATATGFAHTKSTVLTKRRDPIQGVKVDSKERMLVEQQKLCKAKAMASSTVPRKIFRHEGASLSLHQTSTRRQHKVQFRRHSLPSTISHEKRFGGAFTELKRRIGVTQSRNKFNQPKDVKREVDKNCAVVFATVADSQNIQIESVRNTPEATGLNESKQKLADTIVGSSENPSSVQNPERIETTAGRSSTPQCQVISANEEQRKGSLGILKTPSRCSSADCATDKKRLKVTFVDEVVQKAQDEICDQHTKKSSQRPLKPGSKPPLVTARKISAPTFTKGMR